MEEMDFADKSKTDRDQWWQSDFYKTPWPKWRKGWLGLNAPDRKDTISEFAKIGCDPKVIVRLAFLVACDRPLPRGPLSGEGRRRQQIIEKVCDAVKHLREASFLLENLSDEGIVTLATWELPTMEQLSDSCIRGLRVALWGEGSEPPSGTELFVLSRYVLHCSGSEHYNLLAQLLPWHTSRSKAARKG